MEDFVNGNSQKKSARINFTQTLSGLKLNVIIQLLALFLLIGFYMNAYSQATQTYTLVSGTGNACSSSNSDYATCNSTADNNITGWSSIPNTMNQTKNKWFPLTLPVGFQFSFFGDPVTATTCYVSLNGLVTFDPTITSSSIVTTCDNTSLPTTLLPSKTVACFWDLFVKSGSNDVIRYKVYGSTIGKRELWIKWCYLDLGGSATKTSTDNTMCVVFRESSNDIVFIDMSAGSLPKLTSTVGMQYSSTLAINQGSNLQLKSPSTANSNNNYYWYSPSRLPMSDVLFNSTDLNDAFTKSTTTNIVVEPSSSISCIGGEINGASVSKATLKALLSVGDEYVYGSSFTSPVKLNVKIRLYNAARTLLKTYTDTFLLTYPNVEQLLSEDITSYYNNLDVVTIAVTSYSPSSTTVNGIAVSSTTSFKVSIERDIAVAVKTVASTSPTIATFKYVPITTAANPITFAWQNLYCQNYIPEYELQVLRLYNTDATYTTSTKVKAIVDWSKAATMLIENGVSSVNLNMIQGSGYYIWRVRPIGNYYEGGYANNNNWGLWLSNPTATPNDGDAINWTSSVGLPNYAFYYSETEEDKNWIHQKVFTEDNSISETRQYANGLGMLAQTQHHLQNDGSLLITPNSYDYNGRPAIQFLAVPVTGNNFNYVENLIQDATGALYGPSNFDAEDNYTSPDALSGGLLGMYYSESNTLKTIPSAGGYPFSNTYYKNDGTNRPSEQSSTGDTLKMGRGHTVTISYLPAKESELIKVLGNEAPSDTTCYKTVTKDQNGVVTVSFNTFDGKPLITCLGALSATSTLSAIPVPANEALSTYTDNISATSKIGDYTYVKSTSGDFNSDVTLTYTLSPKDIESECGSYCSTCDYAVTFFAQNMDNNQYATHTSGDTSIVITAGTCSTLIDHSLTATWTLTGNFTLGRKVVVNSKEVHEDAVEAIVVDELTGLDAAIAYLNQDDPDPDQFYATLLADASLNATEVDGDGDGDSNSYGDSIYFSTGCCSFALPIQECILPCDTMTTDANGNPNFEYAFNKFLGYYSNYTNSTYLYLHDINGYSKFPLNTEARTTFSFSSGGSGTLSLGFNFNKNEISTAGSMSGGSDIVLSLPFSSGTTTSNILASAVSEFNTAMESEKITTATGSYAPYVAYADGDDFVIMPEFRAGTAWDGSISILGDLNVLNLDGTTCTTEKTIDFTYSTNSSNWSSTYGNTANLEFGNGAFNKLIANMLAEKDANGNAVYECNDLYYKLIGILSSISSEENLLNRDIYQEFLNAAGTIYSSVNSTAWAALTFGYEDVYVADRTATSFTDCVYNLVIQYGGDVTTDINTTTGSPTNWDADVNCVESSDANNDGSIGDDEMAAYQECLNNNKWTALYNCVNGSDISSSVNTAMADGGITTALSAPISAGTFTYADARAFQDAAEDSCTALCELRSDVFKQEILVAWATAYAAGGTGAPISEAPTAQELSCILSQLIDSCKQDCDLTITYKSYFEDATSVNYDLNGDGTINHTAVEVVSSIGTDIEAELMAKAMTWAFDIQYLANGAYGTSCGSDYGKIAEINFVLSEHVVEEMNDKLSAFVSAGNTILTQAMMLTWLDEIYQEYGYTDWPCDFLTNETQFKVDVNSYFEATNMDGSTPLISRTQLDKEFRLISAANFNYKWGLATGADPSYVGAASTRLYDMTTLSTCEEISTCGICFKWVEPTMPDDVVPVDIQATTCEDIIKDNLMSLLLTQEANCKDEQIAAIGYTYDTTCPDIDDKLTITYVEGLHDYTLYYYDRNGNLVRTVPPKGVDADNTSRADVPSHTFVTNYQYNSRGQLVYKSTPDAGIIHYYYNDLGQVRFSQNAQQLLDKKYSYLKYDNLGRVVEAGQDTICSSCNITAISDLTDKANVQNIPTTPGEDLIVTVYNDEYTSASYTDEDGVVSTQENLLNRISYSYSDADGSVATLDDRATTAYSYDVQGNVKWVIQEIPGIGITQVGFEYDLISGKVTEVKYQEGKVDQYYHRYTYDADNRIKMIESSGNGKLWDKDAQYEYYAHGPLSRVVMGEDKVQGLDYVYTLQGWLKGINTPALSTSLDPGKDGASGSKVASDAFGLMLNYYEGDFNRSGSVFNNNESSNTVLTSLKTSHSGTDYKNYYNGFISNAISNNAYTGSDVFNANKPMAGMYLYDELGRLLTNTFDFYSSSSWGTNTNKDYLEQFGYDANGNITSVSRNGH